MATLRLTTWLKKGRRLLAGAGLGLAFAGSAFAQGPQVDRYPHTYGTQSTYDVGYSNGSSIGDFGPSPTDFGHTVPNYETRKPVFDRDNLWQTPSDFGHDGGAAPTAPAELTEAEKIDRKLSARYGNPVVERFVKGTSANRFAELYLEMSRLIDSRHIEPTTYQVRVGRAVENLKHAVRNQEFRRVNGLAVSAAQEQAFVRELEGYVASQQVRTANDALRVMTGVASIAQRGLRLSASAVAAEFVYGATESLDEYSAFNPEAPSARPSASTGLEDSVVGIGVEIKPHEDGVIVLKALRGGPAERAGLQRGDVVTGVNGQGLAGRTMDFAVDQIAGPQGSPVLLDVIRDGRQMQVSMRRQTVRVYSVSDVQMIDPSGKIGYIKLDKFAEASSSEMDEALWALHRQGMKSLVIDLRGNPGGLLTTAIELSDKFLPGGTIVSTRGRTAEDNTQETATRPKTWKTPLAVLVDENSASASEIFAAAIQDNGRGLIVGRKSYGKGTVQTHFPLRTVSGNLKITTAKFYSPSGRTMAKAGVTPDVAVPKTGDDQTLVSLTEDMDVRRAVEVASGNEVLEMAAAAERGGSLLSRR